MADNYLEKKFEEYAAAKAGKRTARRIAPSGSRQGVVELKFPRRRVFVAIDARRVVEAFCNACCQTAFCANGAADAMQFAESVGAQCHDVNCADTDTVCLAMDKAMKAWRDIEILVCDARNAQPLIQHFEALRQSLPMAPDYGRIIVVGEDFELPSVQHHTVNGIVCSDADTLAVANTCIFLSLPDSDKISGQTIRIG